CVAASSGAEFRRKVRVTARGFASVWSRRALLDPRRHGFYALQLFTHKVLRRSLGVPVAVAFVSALALAPVDPLYAGAAALRGLARGAARGGGGLPDRPAARVLALPLYVDLVLAAGVLALIDVARGRRHLVWEPDRRAEPVVAVIGEP